MKQNNNLSGFIQIPLLIVIIAGVLVIGGASYVGVKQYQNYQAEKIKKEKVAQEKEKQAQALAEVQEESLEEAKQEIEKLKQEQNKQRVEADLLKKCATLNSAVDRLVAGCPANSKPQPQKIIVPPQNNYQQSAADLAKFIVRIICSDGSSPNPNESQITGGSGTIFGLNKFIITNFHVVEGAVLCSVGITDNIKNPPSRWYEAAVVSSIPSLDIAMLKPTQILPDSVSTIAYNLCPSEEIKLGDEIIVLGYPIVGGNTITATEGVISGFEGFMLKASAKIEHGNSGGGAFLKKDGCWFGIPTSVTKGELESLGSIINYSLIHEQAQQ